MTVSTIVEIPESLHSSFVEFLSKRPDWDHDRVMSAALSLFLLQNRSSGDRSEDHSLARTYLDSLFKCPVERL